MIYQIAENVNLNMQNLLNRIANITAAPSSKRPANLADLMNHNSGAIHPIPLAVITTGLEFFDRNLSVNGDTGNAFEMDAIGSCFIGGASAYGGSGTVAGICIGAIFLGVINQGMSIIGLDNNWQYIVKGAVLLVAVIFDVVSNHKTGKAG